MRQEFRANGKLMLTGEYFVLDGAKSLALPTRYGQSLVANTRSDANIHWSSLDLNGDAWFKTVFHLDQNARKHSNPVEDRLIHILSTAREMNPGFMATGAEVVVEVDFDLKWGLGSSSTLISLVAQWAGVNPYELQFSCFGGSGYDIACATANGPIIYNRRPKPTVTVVEFLPPFIDQLYFVYLGKKQNSRDGIKHYRGLNINKEPIIRELDSITERLVSCNKLDLFEELLNDHEDIIAQSLGLSKVKEMYFNDHQGSCKSLGAWGGDFVLATSNVSKEETMGYFNSKGFEVCIPYNEMVL